MSVIFLRNDWFISIIIDNYLISMNNIIIDNYLISINNHISLKYSLIEICTIYAINVYYITMNRSKTRVKPRLNHYHWMNPVHN